MPEGTLPTWPKIPMVPQEEVRTYWKSPSELWVYMNTGAVGVGTHLYEPPEQAALRDMSARFVRTTMMWSLWYEKPAEQKLGWDYTLRHIIKPQGLEPIILVHTEPEGYGWQNREAAFDLLAKDMERLAREYPEVRYWELFNEMNVGFGTLFGQHLHDWGKEIDRWVPHRERGQIYAQMLKKVYPAIKRGNPDAFVIFGGVTPSYVKTREDEGAPPHLDAVEEFYRGAYEAGARDVFDIMNIHSYGEPLEPVFRDAGHMALRVMSQYGDRDKPLINTEFGMAANNVICTWGIPQGDPWKAFDEIQLRELRRVVEYNQRTRLYWQITPYNLQAEAEMHHCDASKAAADTVQLPAGRTWNDWGYGLLRWHNRYERRPAFEYLAAHNRSIDLSPRTIDVRVELPAGARVEGHVVEGGLIRNVQVDPAGIKRLKVILPDTAATN